MYIRIIVRAIRYITSGFIFQNYFSFDETFQKIFFFFFFLYRSNDTHNIMALIPSDAVAIGVGAALGALSRYQAGRMAAEFIATDPNKLSKLSGWHTCGINIGGSFLLGGISASPVVVPKSAIPPLQPPPPLPNGITPPDLMRIGTPAEDAFRRDLTINALFYNVNNGQVEDWTGRGFDDLRRGIVATPLAPLTTLLDDPLRALRSVRFAARLRFTMDDALVEAAMDERVREALAGKVSRERVGCEVDLMLRSPDPVGAMRLLINLNLVRTVFPVENCFKRIKVDDKVFEKGLDLLSITHEHLNDCKLFPPVWCQSKKTYTTHGTKELTLREDEEARRFLWYASFLKPLHDHAKQLSESQKSRRQGRKANRSTICKLLVDELKRPARDADSIEKIMRGANEFTQLMSSGCDLSAISVLLSDIYVQDDVDSTDGSKLKCSMNGEKIYSATEEDPVWLHAMEFRLLCSKILNRVGPLWRAALFLSLSEQMSEQLQGDLEYAIEGDIVSRIHCGHVIFFNRIECFDFLQLSYFSSG